jgi:hypothetical protein
MQSDYIYMGTMAWDREVHNVGIWFPEDLTHNEDWEFKIRCFHEMCVEHLPYKTLKYRRWSGNTTYKNQEGNKKAAEIVLARCKELYAS